VLEDEIDVPGVLGVARHPLKSGHQELLVKNASPPKPNTKNTH
jgi:hypothetical protein